jgi:hypothetical protein
MANHATLHGIHTGAQVAGALLVGDVMGAGLRQVYHALEHGEALEPSAQSFSRWVGRQTESGRAARCASGLECRRCEVAGNAW